ncbi:MULTISPECIES: hypothetical protein [Streptomyces]|uniref:Roadblock/LC7 domain-containing protein n=2 Tax=Streptomyces rochei group TaxID=2867164 RepID=A0ABW7ECB9_STRRO|nr:MULTISPECIES: hypothetical protein [Streptomyces]MBU8553383.1 hypothetical protein [Streptomyces sp. Osf17]MBU8560175.1 hypothetical protein [Streptomyces sp. Babs14]NUV95188.1 hypothetical protein [Streptomyces sp. KAI 90]QCB26176.1 hypothetical protein E5N77_33390 [Streptomyces sp. SS52]RSS68208.1 hypothetical protein EF907_12415 [Streptomyces sp. WAC06273]
MPGIDESLVEAIRLPGARGASLVDWISGLALGAVGDAPGGDWEATAAQTAELARHVAENASLGAGGIAETDKEPAVEDLIATTGDAYHLLRFVSTPFDSTVFLHLWLDRNDGNLALARIRLAELAERLVLG